MIDLKILFKESVKKIWYRWQNESNFYSPNSSFQIKLFFMFYIPSVAQLHVSCSIC